MNLAECQNCPLWTNRSQVVIGRGTGGLFAVSDQPGEEEDLTGEPLYGRELLLIEGYLKESGWEQAYYTKAVKCYSKKKTQSRELHIQQCRPWLLQEIELLAPRVILAMGELSAWSLTGLKRPIPQIAGIKIPSPYTQASVVPWYSPSYLLRRGKKMDLQTVQLLRSLRFLHEQA